LRKSDEFANVWRNQLRQAQGYSDGLTAPSRWKLNRICIGNWPKAASPLPRNTVEKRTLILAKLAQLLPVQDGVALGCDCAHRPSLLPASTKMRDGYIVACFVVTQKAHSKDYHSKY
jgi:hypothetical protein